MHAECQNVSSSACAWYIALYIAYAKHDIPAALLRLKALACMLGEKPSMTLARFLLPVTGRLCSACSECDDDEDDDAGSCSTTQRLSLLLGLLTPLAHTLSRVQRRRLACAVEALPAVAGLAQAAAGPRMQVRAEGIPRECPSGRLSCALLSLRCALIPFMCSHPLHVLPTVQRQAEASRQVLNWQSWFNLSQPRTVWYTTCVPCRSGRGCCMLCRWLVMHQVLGPLLLHQLMMLQMHGGHCTILRSRSWPSHVMSSTRYGSSAPQASAISSSTRCGVPVKPRL